MLALGYANRGEFLRAVGTAEELTEWMEFAAIEPFGEWRADLRSAMAASAICRTQGAKVDIEDFMPKFDELPPKPKSDEHKAFVAKLIAMGAKVEAR